MPFTLPEMAKYLGEDFDELMKDISKMSGGARHKGIYYNKNKVLYGRIRAGLLICLFVSIFTSFQKKTFESARDFIQCAFSKKIKTDATFSKYSICSLIVFIRERKILAMITLNFQPIATILEVLSLLWVGAKIVGSALNKAIEAFDKMFDFLYDRIVGKPPEDYSGLSVRHIVKTDLRRGLDIEEKIETALLKRDIRNIKDELNSLGLTDEQIEEQLKTKMKKP